ncbi:M4 family metallopeptidase [Nostocaceae cyanobacterium CENA369]|uniref:Neutral metalloproteinase n=1 Tax=Dendronalium phyllosphericum CENA369 TaxID=1725256 RepID=A0A8J7IG39_9NOST|nr:M4 family metallopeptidase [Dendronalium phyllosphericum]MBH8577205.1 M4 family metallopeptidase [Dendronalium phyllosphericum CENA369]
MLANLVRKEGDPPSQDEAVNEAYDYSGDVYDFYKEVFNRDSLDDAGYPLISSVHVGDSFGGPMSNAFFNGRQMAYGDGDGKLFVRFTKSLDVVGHELTHGVVSRTSNLEYFGESGALNESFADVMGSLVTQWKNHQTADQADWYIGNEILGSEAKIKCLRTLKGEKAYENDPVFGTDPQPKHYKDLYTGSRDRNGVHINSGIPNHVFYQLAMTIGGYAWKKAGQIWYKTMLALNTKSDMKDAAKQSYIQAGSLFGNNSLEQQAVKKSWDVVGLPV